MENSPKYDSSYLDDAYSAFQQEQFSNDHYTTKADNLNQARDNKLNALQYKLGKGVGSSDLSKTTEVVDGNELYLENKILNDYTPSELNYFQTKRYEEAGVYPNIDPETQQVTGYLQKDAAGNLVPFQGTEDDIRSLYLFGTKGSEDVNKLGVSWDPEAYGRYTPKYGDVNTDAFGKPIGPVGVNRDDRKMALAYRGEEADLFEALRHGNRPTIDNREYLNKEGTADDSTYWSDRSEFGTGAIEAYKGGLTGLFGSDYEQPLPADIEDKYQAFKEKYGLSDYARPEATTGNTIQDWMNALVQVESGGNPNAISEKGAFGLTQLMPATAKDPGFGIEPMKENTPEEQLRVGTEYFQALNDKYGNTDDALRAYNWGTGNVDKWIANGRSEDAIPEETKQYVDKVKNLLPQTTSISAEGTPVSTSFEERYNLAKEQSKYEEAQDMGVGDRLVNAGKALAKSLAKESVVDFADWVGEATHVWKGKTEAEKEKFVNELFNYNPYASAAGLEEAKKLGTKITDDLLTEGKSVDLSDVAELAWKAIENPEILGESLGSTLAMIIPYLGWAGKASKVGKANTLIKGIESQLKSGAITKETAKRLVGEARKDVTALNSVVDMLRKNAGVLQVSAGDVNDQIDQYIALHGEEPSVAKVSSMFVTQSVMNALDKGVDISILKNSKGAIDSLAKAVNILPKGDKLALVNRTLSTMGTIAKNSTKEAAQEYAQTMGEILNVQLNFDKEGNPSVSDILTSPTNVAEGITSAGIGAGMGAELSAAGIAKEHVGKLFDMTDMVSAKKAINKATEATNRAVSALDKEPAQPKSTPVIETITPSAVPDINTKEGLKSYMTSANRLVTALDKEGPGITDTNLHILVDDITNTKAFMDNLGDSNPELKSKFEFVYNKGIDSLEGFIRTNSSTRLSKRTLEELGIDPTKVLGSEVKEEDYTDAQRAAIAESLTHVILGSERNYDDAFKEKIMKFAEVNNVAADKIKAIINSYSKVRSEARDEARGYLTQENQLKRLLTSGSVDKNRLSKSYNNLRSFLNSTENSIKAIENSIKVINAKVAKMNANLSKTSQKNTQLPTTYKKLDGTPFNVNVKFVDGKYVPDYTELRRRLLEKQKTASEISRIFNEINEDASKHIKTFTPETIEKVESVEPKQEVKPKTTQKYEEPEPVVAEKPATKVKVRDKSEWTPGELAYTDEDIEAKSKYEEEVKKEEPTRKTDLVDILTESIKETPVNNLLNGWKDIAEIDRLSGKTLEAEVTSLAEAEGIQVEPKSIMQSLITTVSTAIGKPPIWEEVSVVNGKTVVIPKWKEPTEERKAIFKKGEPFNDFGTKRIPLAIRKVETDITKVLQVNKPTVLNTIPVSKLPTELQDLTTRFINAAKKTIPMATQGETILAEESGKKIDGRFPEGGLFLYNSPARALLLGKEGKISPEVALASQLAVLETITTDKSKLLKGSKKTEDIAQFFDVQDWEVTSDMRNFVKDIGSYQKTVANKIGKATLKQLGIGRKDIATMGAHLYDRLVSDLGNTALKVAETQGLIEFVEKSSDELAYLMGALGEGKGATVSFVNIKSREEQVKDTKYSRQVPTPKVESAIGLFKEVSDILPEAKSSAKGPLLSKPTAEEIEKATSTVRNDKVGQEIPQEAKDTIEFMMNTPFVVDVNRIKDFLAVVDQNEDNVKASLGYIKISNNDKFNSLTFEQREVQEAINNDVEKSINDLREFIGNNEDKAVNGQIEMYFNVFYTGNGRYNLDTTSINPQTDKLHRFLVLPKALEINVYKKGNHLTVNGKDVNYQIRSALGQAFGFGIDKESPEDVINLGNILLSMNTSKLAQIKKDIINKGESEIWVGKGDAAIKYELEAEHLSHSLQAIDFLEQLQKSDKITTMLSAEYDSLTSGFANKTQQFPVLGEDGDYSVMHEHFARVGILTREYLDRVKVNSKDVVAPQEGKGVNNLLAKGADVGFFDSYKNLAKNVLDRMRVDIWKVDGKDRNLFTGLAAALPGGDTVLGNGTIQVDSAMRNLFKNPFMIFNYSAGISRIASDLSDNIASSVFEKIAKADLTDKEDAGTKAATFIVNRYKTLGDIATLQERIRTEPTNAIRIGKRSLFQEISEMGKNTYGKQVKEVFNDQFAPYLEIQDLTNDTFKVMFRVFDQKRMNLMKDKLAEKGYVSRSDQKEIMNTLWENFPYIMGPLTKSGKAKDIIPVVSMEVGSPNMIEASAVSPQTRLIGNKSKVVNPLVMDIGEASKKGSVTPFHFIDGAEISKMIEGMIGTIGSKESGLLAIHDAIIPSLLHSDQAQFEYNKGMYELNKNYSIIEKLHNRLQDINSNFDGAERVSVEGLSIESDGTLNNALEVLNNSIKEKVDEVTKAREFWYNDVSGPLSTAIFGNMIGTPGGTFRPGMTKPDTSYTRAMKKNYKKVYNISVGTPSEGKTSNDVSYGSIDSLDPKSMVSKLNELKKECE